MKLGFFLLFTAVILVSGCVQSPEFLAKSDPIVKEFLEKYPNAQVKVVFFSREQIQSGINSIRDLCGNGGMEPKDYYILGIEDIASNLSVVALIDWNNKRIDCAVKKPVDRPTFDRDKETPVVISNRTEEQPLTPEYPPTMETPVEKPIETPIEQPSTQQSTVPTPTTQPPDVAPPKIKVSEPLNGSTLSSRSYTAKVETDENSTCSYSIGFYPLNKGISSAFSIYKPMGTTGNTIHQHTLENLYDSNKMYISCVDNSKNSNTAEIVFFVGITRWAQEQISFNPQKLDVKGGSVEITITSQEDGLRPVNNVEFTLTKPDKSVEGQVISANCGITNDQSYKTKCWKAVFHIPANGGNTQQIYAVKVSSRDISDTRSGSFIVDTYSGPPIISLGYATDKYVNNSVIFYKSRSFAVETNINSTCSYIMKVSNAASSQDFPEKQMITADKTYHSDRLSDLQPGSAYDINVTCTHLSYSSAAFITFRTNATLEEEPQVFTT